MSSTSEQAESLKREGNERYLACAYAEAIELYKRAASLKPEQPVYLSNMSAAQLEDGQYTEALVSCGKALTLLDTVHLNHRTLRTKVLGRRAKLLTFLHAEDPGLLVEASAACETLLLEDPQNKLALAQKDALRRRQGLRNLDKKINQRLADTPRYRCTLTNVLEYYTVGHDVANSIFRVQYTSDDDPARTNPRAGRFHVRVPRDGTRFDFSALFCGPGDARHIYASLADVGLDIASVKKSSKVDAPTNINIHFTMIDINPSALARDLIILTLLSELSSIPTAQHKNNSRALDLLLALHYTYWGTTMPRHAHAILEKVLDKLSVSVTKALDQDVALNLGWLYVEPNTLKEVDLRLKWWQGEGKTALSFDAILPSHIESDSSQEYLNNHIQMHPHDREAMQSLGSKEHDSMLKYLQQDPEARARCESEAKKEGMTTDDYIKILMDSVTPEDLQMYKDTPANSHWERRAWKYLKVMVPPPHAREAEFLDKVFRALRGDFDNPALLFASPDILTKAFESIRTRWRANFTLLDKDWLAVNNGHATDLGHCPFKGTLSMCSPHHMLQACPKTRTGGIYEWSAQFFSLVADGMTRLRECGDAFKLEVVLGDGYAVMEQIKLDVLTREPAFPVHFDRIHASNVPDYVGGYLASFTTAIPLLKPLRTSYFTSCSLLNSAIWEGGFSDGKFDLNLDSALYTYAGITRADTQAAYGVSIECQPAFAADYHTFCRLQTIPKRLDKAQIAAVAYACFIKTVLPVKYERYNYASTIREVQNVHAFFRLLEVLKDLRYAPHVLADIVESILENRVSNSPVPHNVTPIPLASRNQRTILCTTPFQAEFEVAAVMWEPKLFPICSRLIHGTNDIVRYAVRLHMAHIPLEKSIPYTHAVLALIFGLPHDLDADITELRNRLTGTRECRTSVQLVSTFHYDTSNNVATFLLSRERMKKFTHLGFEVAILNTIFWRVQSMKVSCADIETVGDLDVWDKARRLTKPRSRGLTAPEMQGWTRDLTRGCYGPSSPSMGGGNPTMDMFAALGAQEAQPSISDMMASLLGTGFE